MEQKKATVKFINELGNKIEINTRIGKDQKDGTILVHYGIIGPTSEMGNTITWREATCLVNLLKRYWMNTMIPLFDPKNKVLYIIYL